jgi:hypothetical protein
LAATGAWYEPDEPLFRCFQAQLKLLRGDVNDVSTDE